MGWKVCAFFGEGSRLRGRLAGRVHFRLGLGRDHTPWPGSSWIHFKELKCYDNRILKGNGRKGRESFAHRFAVDGGPLIPISSFVLREYD